MDPGRVTPALTTWHLSRRSQPHDTSPSNKASATFIFHDTAFPRARAHTPNPHALSSTMDYSTMNNSFYSSTANFNASTTSIPDKNKEKRFYDWHNKQGISAPQDYPTFAAQPAPFSNTPHGQPQPTAATPYLQKVSQHAPAPYTDPSDTTDPFPDRRKPSLRRTNSTSPPTPQGTWPRSQFGTRPPSRIRRTSATPDSHSAANPENNLPPLASIYDDLSFPASPPTSDLPAAPPSYTLTPTAVRVANFSEDRFPDLIRALRQFYGVILEAYSGLPESESKFPDPEIYPRDKLDAKVLAAVQPCAGADGGPGPWVRVTFAEREAAERAVAGAERAELVIGGRRIMMSMWAEEPVAMELDEPVMSSVPVQQQRRRRSSVVERPDLSRPTESSNFGGGNGHAEFSSVMPGAKIAVAKPVEFAKKEGWLSSWTNSLGKTVAAPQQQQGQGQGGWGQTLVGGYRYVMDDLVGFKHL